MESKSIDTTPVITKETETMESKSIDTTPVITKETKNKISVDYEGKLTFKERLVKKLKTSHTWIKVIVNIFRFILMLGVSYVILFPFFSKIAGSFMSKSDVVDATVSLIPKAFTLDIYKFIITENLYFKAFFNTLLISLLCAVIQTFIACLVGYGLAKFKFKGNGIVMALVVVTMVIPHTTLEFSMVRHFNAFELGHIMSFGYNGLFQTILGTPLSLENTYFPLMILSLCGLALKNGLYIYLMRQFFKGVPDELEESAYVDGSGTFRTFLQIILPLSVPMMITIFLFSFSWQWTDQFYVGMFIKDGAIWLFPDIMTVPESLYDPSFGGAPLYNSLIYNTAGIMIILPLVIMYLFCQKYLVQGIERSGLVG